MQLNEYSLWLLPDKDSMKKLDNIIISLSMDYSSPVFKPHLTLLGRLEPAGYIKETYLLASLLEPMKISLSGAVPFGRNYKSIVSLAKKSRPLMKANLMAREIFSEQSQPEYVPHLSLIYGDFPENIENELTSRLSDFNLEFETKNLGLYKLNVDLFDEINLKL